MSTISDENLTIIGKQGIVQGSVLILGASWSKTSFALTLVRLTKGWIRVVIWVIIATMNVFFSLTIVIGFVQCDPVGKIWNPYGKYHNLLVPL
jgi:hypothetical protein